MAKKDNLPKTVETDNQDSSSVVYAGEVVATIAGVAASEVEGVAEMCNVTGSFLGRNRNLTKGVKVEVGPEEVSVDLYIIVEYERPMHKVAQEIQENVRRAIESMTSLHVVRVDVHVQGVSFEKQDDGKKAALPGGEAKPAKKSKKATKAKDTPAEPAAEEKPAEDKPYTVELTEAEEAPAPEAPEAE
ncbi:MAG: Asp23/Gls24 family envelope stress response protein [Clostridia bacterium]|nr:Asp23/Gls24 family envelope stress response protein [Clostridia bacterium]